VRSLWKGAISFGLVNIPVRLYAATENKSVSFNYLHRACHTPIRYAKMCPACRVEVSQEDLIRGYEIEPGRYVTIEERDVENLPLPTGRTVEILDFIDLAEIDPVYYEKSYYLEPGDGAIKPYALLRRAMQQSGKAAIAKIAIRSRSSLCCLRVYQDVLALETMHYPDEVRSVQRLEGLAAAPPVSETELRMADALIQGLTAPFQPEKYTDDYRAALLELIRVKAAGGEIHAAQPTAAISPQVVDLMAALEASLQALEKEKGARPGADGAGKKEPAVAGRGQRRRS
jgi:DNA end-binding protein Ku